MESVFADVYARTGDATYAAHKAGSKAPAAVGRDMLSKPQVRETALEKARAGLGERIVPALAILDDLLIEAKEKKASFKDRARLVVDVFKLNQSHALGDASRGKDPHEMTADELHAESERLRRQQAMLEVMLSDRALVVDGAEIPSEPEDSRLPPDPFA